MVAGRCAPFTPSSSSFPYSAGPSTKSCTGLMEWADQEAVLDVFVLTNHQTIYSQSMPSSFSSLLVQHMRTSHSLWSSSLLLFLLLLLLLLLSPPLPPLSSSSSSSLLLSPPLSSSSFLFPSPDGQAYTFKMAFSNNTSLEQYVAGQGQMREPL